MTKVVVKKHNNDIVFISLDGHTGYGVEGEDIVCAGLSCIAQTAVLGVFSVAKVNAECKRDEEKGFLSLSIPKDISISQREAVNVILETALLGISDLRESFSDFIEVEVIDDVY